MKLKQKLGCWLAGALAIGALAGCSTDRSQGGTAAYSSDTGSGAGVSAAQERSSDRDIGAQGQNWGVTTSSNAVPPADNPQNPQ